MQLPGLISNHKEKHEKHKEPDKEPDSDSDSDSDSDYQGYQGGFCMLGAHLNAVTSKLQVQSKSFITSPAVSWLEVEQLKAAYALEQSKKMIIAFKEKIEDWKKFSGYRNETTNIFFWLSNIKRIFTVPYKFFTKKLYCCEKTIQRLTDDLSEIGLLTKKFNFKKPNSYRFNDIVYTPEFRSMFMKEFGALAKQAIFMIKSSGSGGVQQSFNNKYNNNTAVNIYTKVSQTAAKNIQSENRYLLHPCTETIKTADWHITLTGRIKLQIFSPSIITQAYNSPEFTADQRWVTLIRLCKELHWLSHIPINFAAEYLYFQHYNTNTREPYIQFFRNKTVVQQEKVRPRLTCERCPSSAHSTENHVATYDTKPVERTTAVATPSKRHEIVFTSLLEEMDRIRKENAAKGKQ